MSLVIPMTPSSVTEFSNRVYPFCKSLFLKKPWPVKSPKSSLPYWSSGFPRLRERPKQSSVITFFTLPQLERHHSQYGPRSIGTAVPVPFFREGPAFLLSPRLNGTPKPVCAQTKTDSLQYILPAYGFSASDQSLCSFLPWTQESSINLRLRK